MKKLISIFALLLLFVVGPSCDKNKLSGDMLDPDLVLLTEFVNTSDFSDAVTNNPLINTAGEIDLTKSKVDNINVDGDDYYLLNILVSKNEEIRGQVMALKLQNGKKRIKSGHEYLMAFRDFSNFNFSNYTGVIMDYDLNYDSYLCGTITINNNQLDNIIVKEMPSDIRSKYNFKQRANKDVHPCDASEDGDVSFGECYKCLKAAIESDAIAEFLCDIVDLQCYGSIAIACAVVASKI